MTDPQDDLRIARRHLDTIHSRIEMSASAYLVGWVIVLVSVPWIILLGLPLWLLAVPSLVLAGVGTSHVCSKRWKDQLPDARQAVTDAWLRVPGPCGCGFPDKHEPHELRCTAPPGYNTPRKCEGWRVSMYRPVPLGSRLP